ncbi:DUF4912 domain-containing protein [Vulcanococcus sp. Clear-D1]|uniref:DUF4912 domain-containing protein n=1 Tax=Vulcanococcus sp. Clear-D1 TaxID=2766970 RepID=UPI0025E732CB|nr:DUF4912 domain-containing protein [Vulcanococcus sp. Clear-D1]
MTEAKRPLSWLKKLVPSALRSGSCSDSAKKPAAPASAPAASPAGQPAAPVTTHVVFLPRDPQWAYCFWAISDLDRQKARDAGATSLCLRVADVTGLGADQSHPHALQEMVVDNHASEWFLPVPVDGRDYRVELGFRLRNGGWYSLAFSAVAQVPALEPSQRVADAFVPFSLDQPLQPAASPEVTFGGGVAHEQIYQIATAAGTRSRRVGSEVLHELDASQQGLLNDSGAGVWASGRSESGSGLVRQRSFWLVADAELIVYGATDPSASLFIGDQQVPLSSDGTFRVHVPFRDGEQLYPIRAIAADGEQERSIRLEFERRTPEARVNRREDAVAEWF